MHLPLLQGARSHYGGSTLVTHLNLTGSRRGPRTSTCEFGGVGGHQHSVHNIPNIYLWLVEVFTMPLVQEPCSKQRKPWRYKLSLRWKRYSVLHLEKMAWWTEGRKTFTTERGVTCGGRMSCPSLQSSVSLFHMSVRSVVAKLGQPQ